MIIFFILTIKSMFGIGFLDTFLDVSEAFWHWGKYLWISLIRMVFKFEKKCYIFLNICTFLFTIRI